MMPKDEKVNACLTLMLAVVFYLFFQLCKQQPALLHVNAFATDPYDIVGSFGTQFAVFTALLSMVRAFRPYQPNRAVDSQQALLERGAKPAQHLVALVEQLLAVHQQEAPKPETQAKEPTEMTGQPRLKRYIRVALPGPQVHSLLDRYVTLWEQADIPGLAALLREDAWFAMPPIPAWVQGRAAIATLLSTSVFSPSRRGRLQTTRANGRPSLVCLSSLVWWSWRWWASRLEVSLHS